MKTIRAGLAASMGVIVAAIATSCGGSDDDSAAQQAALVEQGKQIFRFDTFGEWTDTLRMHEVIAASVESLGGCSVELASVNVAPLWQLAHLPAPSKTALPRVAAAASKLPAGGIGGDLERCRAGVQHEESLGLTPQQTADVVEYLKSL
jgi:hypothetical protein